MQFVFTLSGRGQERTKTSHLLAICRPCFSQETCEADIWAVQVSSAACDTRNNGVCCHLSLL